MLAPPIWGPYSHLFGLSIADDSDSGAEFLFTHKKPFDQYLRYDADADTTFYIKIAGIGLAAAAIQFYDSSTFTSPTAVPTDFKMFNVHGAASVTAASFGESFVVIQAVSCLLLYDGMGVFVLENKPSGRSIWPLCGLKLMPTRPLTTITQIKPIIDY
jgi:hypothetical protein